MADEISQPATTAREIGQELQRIDNNAVKQASSQTNLPDFDDIALGGISLRGILTFTLLGALIVLTGFKIVEPQYIVALTLTSMGYYFKK